MSLRTFSRKEKESKHHPPQCHFKLKKKHSPQEEKKIKVPEQNNVFLSDDDDDITDKENDEIECF